ncbi:helix-turn-helix domain-containing protein [Spirosoma linguale]|uniref:Transcriptional regulator, XRE family n=1 Tax=Spirosoma linguale (strain ATCC 33905 / DSM 74 / LMG 10896 / Claus 1) TaxID=504472 RepID=D2QH69_SPILD|nr:transcriptional regulator, XRE family [Spirosoma linguale DSM 74]
MTLSANVKQVRKEKGLSQEYMADRLCMSQPTYNRLERNSLACVKRLAQLADALGTTPETLANYHLINEPDTHATEAEEKDRLIQEQEVKITFLSRYIRYLQATWKAYGKGDLPIKDDSKSKRF